LPSEENTKRRKTPREKAKKERKFLIKRGRESKKKKERKSTIKDRKKTEETCRKVFGPDNI